MWMIYLIMKKAGFPIWRLPLAILIFGISTVISRADTGASCTVDWNNVHQRIDGFGGGVVFLDAGLDPITNTNMDTFFGTANTNELGLTLLRVRIDPMTNWTDAMLDGQKAVARGARVL